MYRVAQKFLAKFSRVSSVWADGLCIGFLGSMKEGKFKHGGIFTLYTHSSTAWADVQNDCT